MSVAATEAVWSMTMPSAPDVAASAVKLVALALADHAGNDGAGMWPSVQLLADKTQLHRRTVKRALAVLRERHLIVATSPATNRLPAKYRLGAWFVPGVARCHPRGGEVSPLRGRGATSRGGEAPPEPSLNRQGTPGDHAEEIEPDPLAAEKVRAIRDGLARKRAQDLVSGAQL